MRTFGPPTEPETREQLERLLNNKIFVKRRVQKLLLRFLVERTLAGAVPSEWEVGTQVFDLPANWNEDPNISIVRVTNSRLQKSLVQYYQTDGKRDPIRIVIVERTAVATYRRGPRPIHAEPLVLIEKPMRDALHLFFTHPGENTPRCVVSGQVQDVVWHYLDSDPLNLTLSNLVPLASRLASQIAAVREQSGKTMPPELDPRYLSEQLAPEHFKKWKFECAYGCAALAFHLSGPPFACESDDLRLLRLCDVIYYARHHFLEPIVFGVIDRVLRPFIRRLDALDPICAVRLTIQLTALLEESGLFPEAHQALSRASRLARAWGTLSESAVLSRFALFRREAQVAAEIDPRNDPRFKRAFERAEAAAANVEDNLVNLVIVRVHRWLRHGTPKSLEDVRDTLVPLLSSYAPAVFSANGDIRVAGPTTSGLSELFFLAAIAAVRLQPGGWKQEAQMLLSQGKILMHKAGHVLPTEYASFLNPTMRRNAATAKRLMALSPVQIRRPVREDSRADILGVLECLDRIRILEKKAAPWRR